MTEDEAVEHLRLLDRVYPEYGRLTESRRRLLKGLPGLSVGDTLDNTMHELLSIRRYQRTPEEVAFDDEYEKLTPEDLARARAAIRNLLRKKTGR